MNNDTQCLVHWKSKQLLISLCIHFDGIILCNVDIQIEMTRIVVTELGYYVHLLNVLLNLVYTMSVIIFNAW